MSAILGEGLNFLDHHLGDWAKNAGWLLVIAFAGWRVSVAYSEGKRINSELDSLKAGVKSLTAENDALRRQLLRGAGGGR